VDTAHFKGNFPESCSLEAADAGDREVDEAALSSNVEWRELLPRTKLQAHTRHFFEEELRDAFEATHVRFHIYPDGGVSRLRLYGSVKGVA
jgi:allantoicase